MEVSEGLAQAYSNSSALAQAGLHYLVDMMLKP